MCKSRSVLASGVQVEVTEYCLTLLQTELTQRKQKRRLDENESKQLTQSIEKRLINVESVWFHGIPDTNQYFGRFYTFFMKLHINMKSEKTDIFRLIYKTSPSRHMTPNGASTSKTTPFHVMCPLDDQTHSAMVQKDTGPNH